MRTINYHKINPANDKIEIAVTDEPGSGNANHQYVISTEDKSRGEILLHFQEGPISEVGVNGITQEVLLAIVIDRLRSFQSGPYSCRENAIALTKCEEALLWLHGRTQERMSRGVEGTHKK